MCSQILLLFPLLVLVLDFVAVTLAVAGVGVGVVVAAGVALVAIVVVAVVIELVRRRILGTKCSVIIFLDFISPSTARC